MKRCTITTHQKDEVVDITGAVAEMVPRQGSGQLTVQVLHTTAAVTTADLDPGTDHDLLVFLRKLVPGEHWRHPHDPAHAPDHLLASLIGPSVTIAYEQGELLLGTWQRIILIELDGPRERQLAIAT